MFIKLILKTACLIILFIIFNKNAEFSNNKNEIYKNKEIIEKIYNETVNYKLNTFTHCIDLDNKEMQNQCSEENYNFELKKEPIEYKNEILLNKNIDLFNELIIYSILFSIIISIIINLENKNEIVENCSNNKIKYIKKEKKSIFKYLFILFGLYLIYKILNKRKQKKGKLK